MISEGHWIYWTYRNCIHSTCKLVSLHSIWVFCVNRHNHLIPPCFFFFFFFSFFLLDQINKRSLLNHVYLSYRTNISSFFSVFVWVFTFILYVYPWFALGYAQQLFLSRFSNRLEFNVFDFFPTQWKRLYYNLWLSTPYFILQSVNYWLFAYPIRMTRKKVWFLLKSNGLWEFCISNARRNEGESKEKESWLRKMLKKR